MLIYQIPSTKKFNTQSVLKHLNHNQIANYIYYYFSNLLTMSKNLTIAEKVEIVLFLCKKKVPVGIYLQILLMKSNRLLSISPKNVHLF